MTSRPLLLASFSFLLAPLLTAQTANQPPPTPPPVARALPGPAQPPVQSTEQRLYVPATQTLISREAADSVFDGFRKAYVPADAAPRIVIHVNRALIEKTAATQWPSNANANTSSSANASHSAAAAASSPLSDQQTMRDIERLFGRAFRHAGAQLADYKVAASLLPDPAVAGVDDQAAKQRQALAKVADIAIEILISSRNITVPMVSGDVTYPVPDIQATAIRLKDSAIIGQAAASDIVGKGAQAGSLVRQFDAADITEATAIALMEDMLTGTNRSVAAAR